MTLSETLGRFGAFAGLLLAAYLALVVLVALFQRHLIYQPSRLDESTAQTRAAAQNLQAWHSATGDFIGWRESRPNAAAVARIIVLPGNAGHALHRAFYRDLFARRAAMGDPVVEVFLLEYPGYGPRPGRPNETSLTAAAREAVRALRAENDLPVLLLGESIGSGPAAAAAAAEAVAGLWLITPFSALTDVAAHHYPWLPVRWLLRDRFDNAAALAAYAGPVAILLAEHDEVVPARLGRRLTAELAGPGRVREQPGARHNTLDLSASTPWWDGLIPFLLAPAQADDGGRAGR
jgi:pimeloyl-ACP methyl ester carboxylesterase